MTNDERKLIQYINLKLSILKQPVFGDLQNNEFNEITRSLLFSLQEKNRLLTHHRSPVDERIEAFLNDYLEGARPAKPRIRIPGQTFVLDRAGLARVLSLPPNGEKFESDLVCSYRVKQGVLHNPVNDRRTTKGVFHVVEGGLPIPDDKKAVPRNTFYHLLQHAFTPPPELLKLPFTSLQEEQAHVFISLYMRPVVCPPVVHVNQALSMETRFFAPGSLVSNLDFVESIFGNAGDPSLPDNDAGLDPAGWIGHTGFVLLAPHLTSLTKKNVGLPRWEKATARQRRDSMCWKDPGELYNDGTAFKVTCRDHRGVIVTLIADNYFGYCKKEVKTQISYAANLFGICEEEHAGGAIAYPSYDLGDTFLVPSHIPMVDHTFAEVKTRYSDIMDIQPEGYGIDRVYPNILYVPEDVVIDLSSQSVTWTLQGEKQTIRLLADKVYVLPSGYKVRLTKGTSGLRWRLIGTAAEGTFCHKPCTVSGGGKSEISKSIADAFIHGAAFSADIKKDFERVEEILRRDYSDRFRVLMAAPGQSRKILSKDRSIGSVIKLLTPSTELYTDAYNAWLETIPRYIKELVFIVKQYHTPEWGDNWREHFSVDIINGTPGNELKYHYRKLVVNYLRVGISNIGLWRLFGLRRDFSPALKLQMEDDITASVVIPANRLSYLNPAYNNPSVKFTGNCEFRLFQRPDEAINRGYDKQAEFDLTQPGNFLSNFEPLSVEYAKDLVEDSIGFDQYTEPMQKLIRNFAQQKRLAYFVSSAHPRVINGAPTKNPRYLQVRQDLVDPESVYVANIGTRLFRRVPLDMPVYTPVNAVLMGRRNNPPEDGIRPLAVYNPIHYMELPELFMEFICSMTGKSPSTTGAGSEGALTKAPFNALLPITDLNSAILSYAITGYSGFVTAAGYVGPNYRVDHDISLLIPELWCRMAVNERDPEYLIEHHYLEKCDDFEYEGETVLASRLGYRITSHFVSIFLGRVFNNPSVVFREPMLKPETQDVAVFADGMKNIVATHKRVATMYFKDGSIDMACPPLRALLHIMRDGKYKGKDLSAPEIRELFSRESLLGSEWYRSRLAVKQKIDVTMWQRHIEYLDHFLSRRIYVEESSRLNIKQRLATAREHLEHVKSESYQESLHGTLGADNLGQY